MDKELKLISLEVRKTKRKLSDDEKQDSLAWSKGDDYYEGYCKGKKEGAKAERERIEKIMYFDEDWEYYVIDKKEWEELKQEAKE